MFLREYLLRVELSKLLNKEINNKEPIDKYIEQAKLMGYDSSERLKELLEGKYEAGN
jgi:hypothetical protein